MTTADEQKLIDIKFKLDMYYSMADTAESTLEKIQDDLNPKVKLNENQQVVLDYLIKQAERCSDIGYLVGDLNFFASTEDGKAWAGLTEKERYQVLAAFADWGMEEVASE